MRPWRNMGFGEKCSQAQEFGLSYVLYSHWSEGNANTHFKKKAEERSRFWSINACDEEKGSKLRWIGHFAKVQNSHSGVTTMEEVLTNEKAQVNYPAHQTFLFQQCEKRSESLSQQDRLSNFCVDAGFLMLKLDSICDKRHWRFDTIQYSGLSNAPIREKIQHHNRKDGSKGTPNLDPCWKLQPGTCTVNMEMRSELCVSSETMLTLGSEFLMDQMNLWWIWTTTTQKFLKFSSKNMRGIWMRQIHNIDLFAAVQLLGETSAIPSLG